MVISEGSERFCQSKSFQDERIARNFRLLLAVALKDDGREQRKHDEVHGAQERDKHKRVVWALIPCGLHDIWIIFSRHQHIERQKRAVDISKVVVVLCLVECSQEIQACAHPKLHRQLSLGTTKTPSYNHIPTIAKNKMITKIRNTMSAILGSVLMTAKHTDCNRCNVIFARMYNT